MNVRQRQPRQRDDAWLAEVRLMPCLICGKPGSDPAHIRSAAPQYGKRQTGMGEKPDDRWVLPLCRFHHDAQHAHGDELEWWTIHGIDPFAKAVELYESRPHKPKRERRAHRPHIRKPKSERRSMGKGRPLKSAPRWPPKGQVKFPAHR